MMDFQVLSLQGKMVGTVQLSEDIFGLEPRADILHRMVRYQLSKRRQGNRAVQGRSDVDRTTAKVYKQKGGGRARHGSRRAPLFRGGGKAHGPVVRDHDIGLPKKVRALALKHALSARVKSGGLVVVESLTFDSPKTSVLDKLIKDRGWSSSLIVGGDVLSDFFVRAARNLPKVDVLPIQGLNVYDILRCDHLLLSRAAVEALEARFK